MKKEEPNNKKNITQKKVPKIKIWNPTEEQKKVATLSLEQGIPALTVASSFGVSLTAFKRHFTYDSTPGNRPHVVTEQYQKLIESYSALKLPQKEIAQLMDMSEDTLTKYYRFELERGKAGAHHNLSSVAHSLALQGDKEMLKFVLSRKYDWKEQKGLELTGKDGEAIKIEQSKNSLLASLEDGLENDGDNLDEE